MQISDDHDQENIRSLFEKFGEMAFKADPPFTHREILEALMHAMAATIFSITCPGCRAASARVVKEGLPRIIDHAIKGADGMPSGENHIH